MFTKLIAYTLTAAIALSVAATVGVQGSEWLRGMYANLASEVHHATRH